ncbi:hypothetical protein BJX63DRAFT_405870 [Aspergillus granulosus]|uniref:Rhodopsin domain-containing protein n=1 Tax=Aspergillus granulosus TaxID=176169 RepID=A0ABR4H1V9_9EURO
MYVGLALITAINAVCVYMIYGQCTPTAKLWDSSIRGECWDPRIQRDYAFFQGSASAFADLALAVYPLFTIWRLQTALRLKMSFGILLSLGAVAMVAAIIKTLNLGCLSSRSDYSWDTVDLIIWIAVEQYLIIIAACIPTLAPLVNIAICQHCSRGRGNTSSNQNPTGDRRGAGTKNLFSRITRAQAEEAMYPLAWARSETISGEPGRSASDSSSDAGSEDPVAVARNGRGILLTTEICVRSEYREDRNQLGWE